VAATMQVYQQENTRLRILGIVPTLTRRGTLNHDVGMEFLCGNYASYLMSDIAYRTVWAQAAWENQTVLTYAPDDVAAEEAWNFVDEITDRLEVQHVQPQR
jgi:cellulose biosynthesis protein BcsQ